MFGWSFIDIDNSMIRLYYELDGHHGFYFCALEMVSFIPDKDWDPETTGVNMICNGNALFDGVRHIFFGEYAETGCTGYIYYPNLEGIANVLIELDKLEKLHCLPEEE